MATPVFVVAEVPFEDEVLTLGVAATRSRLRRNCGSCGGRSWSRATARCAELVDHATVTEDPVDLGYDEEG